MRPDQIGLYRTVAAVDVAPDRSQVVFAADQADLDADDYLRVLWLAEASGEGRQLTAGRSDRAPRWSPDGKRLAFLRAVESTHHQLALIDPSGGEAAIITDFPLGVSAFDWAPDSERLVVQAPEYLDPADVDDDERSRRPRRHDRIPYRFDFPRWRGDTVDHLWIVGGEAPPSRLTEGRDSFVKPSWSPVADEIAFLADLTGRRFQTLASQVGVVRPDGTVAELTELGYFTGVTYRTDGVLHAVGLLDEDEWPAPLEVWRLEEKGPVALAPQIDRTVSLANPHIAWSGLDAVYSVDDGGRNRLVSVQPDGVVHHLVDEPIGIDAHSANDDVVVFVRSTATNPGDVVMLRAGQANTIAGPNAELDVPLVEGDHFQVPSGGHEIDAWVYLPQGDGPVPLLLNIHGGPAGQYGFGFFDEFQVYAAAGFGVVACNPRGSSGRGKEWLRAVTGDGWGVVDLADVQAVVEEALRRHPRLDENRKGVMGGSYGGFLTAWLLGHDQSFRSAVVERALIDWTSLVGTSDIASSFPRFYLDATMPSGHERLWEVSPLRLAGGITTPTLIIHSEADYRCPIEQAQQLFFVLMQHDVESALVTFPDEGHEMSRSGSPRHRRERFELILDWHRRHLAG